MYVLHGTQECIILNTSQCISILGQYHDIALAGAQMEEGKGRGKECEAPTHLIETYHAAHVIKN